MRGRRNGSSSNISDRLSLQEIGVGLDHGLVVGSHRRILQVLLLLGLGRSQNWLHHDGRGRRRWERRDHAALLRIILNATAQERDEVRM